MKQWLVTLLLLGCAANASANPITDFFTGFMTRNMFVEIDDDDFDPGVPTGSPFPAVRVLYQGEEIHSLEPLAGPNGLVVYAVRSVNWCIFCISQVRQLQEYSNGFGESGIGLVVLTYDTPEQQEKFAGRYNVQIPLVSDIETASMQALGILNLDYQPGDSAYGIPHPGIYFVDSNNQIAGKVFLRDYKRRVNAAEVLALAKNLLPTDNK